MAFDLESLRMIGWALLGTVMIGFVLCEGLNMGVSMILPALENDSTQIQGLMRFIAPTSLGSLAWLIAMLTLIFAGWPIAYAISLASFYPLLLLILVLLMLRPLLMYFSQDFYNSPWQQYINKLLLAGGLGPAALLGLLAGNMLKGIPFHLDSDMRILFLGDFASFFNVFAMLVAATGVALFAMHAAAFLSLKLDDTLQKPIEAIAIKAGIAFLVFFIAAGLWVSHLEGYHITSDILPNQVSNPLTKFVKRGEGLWLDNYEHLPTLWVVPICAGLSAIAAMVLIKQRRTYWAMLASSTSMIMVVLTFGFSLFPFLLPSNISLNSSLTIWDSSASQLSLQILLGFVGCALPLMILYTRWVFGFFNEKTQDG